MSTDSARLWLATTRRLAAAAVHGRTYVMDVEGHQDDPWRNEGVRVPMAVAREWVRVAPQAGLVYVRIPKNASSTLENLVNEIELRTPGAPERLRANTRRGPRVLSAKPPAWRRTIALADLDSSDQAMVWGRDFTWIAAVRNPFERLLSAYLHMNGLHRGVEWDVNAWIQRFRRFASMLHRRRILVQADAHLWPQCYFLPRRIQARLDVTVRMDRSGVDWDALKEALEGRQSLMGLASETWHSTGASRKADLFYDSEALEDIHAVYRQDFCAFGFQNHLPGTT